MILLTSTTAATTFLTFGLVQLDYAKRLFWVGVGATAVGQLLMTRLVKKTGRLLRRIFHWRGRVFVDGAHGLPRPRVPRVGRFRGGARRRHLRQRRLAKSS